MDRNFIYGEKYGKKNPGKYQALGGANGNSEAGRIAENQTESSGFFGGGGGGGGGHLFGDLSERINRGVSRLMVSDDHDDGRLSRVDHGDRAANIQLTRR